MNLNPQSSAAAYLQAVAALYPKSDAERGGLAIAAAGRDAAADVVLDRSAELERDLIQTASAGPPADREQAALQLLAAAATELAVARDLAATVDGGLVPAGERTAGPGVVADLGPILTSPPGGLAGLVEAEQKAERGARPGNPVAARARLRAAADGAVQSIRDGAVKTGRNAVVGFLQIVEPPLHEAVNATVNEVLKGLAGSVSAVLRRVVSLVGRALEKIFAALGARAGGAIRKQAAEWAEELKSADLFGGLLDRVYETERIKQEVTDLVTAAGPDIDRLWRATGQLDNLTGRFTKQVKVLGWVAQGLAWVRPVVLGFAPWGPIGLTAAYVAVIGYTVYAGGDYLDWYWGGDAGRFDFVTGVRSLVRQAA